MTEDRIEWTQERHDYTQEQRANRPAGHRGREVKDHGVPNARLFIHGPVGVGSAYEEGKKLAQLMGNKPAIDRLRGDSPPMLEPEIDLDQIFFKIDQIFFEKLTEYVEYDSTRD